MYALNLETVINTCNIMLFSELTEVSVIVLPSFLKKHPLEPFRKCHNIDCLPAHLPIQPFPSKKHPGHVLTAFICLGEYF